MSLSEGIRRVVVAQASSLCSYNITGWKPADHDLWTKFPFT